MLELKHDRAVILLSSLMLCLTIGCDVEKPIQIAIKRYESILVQFAKVSSILWLPIKFAIVAARKLDIHRTTMCSPLRDS